MKPRAFLPSWFRTRCTGATIAPAIVICLSGAAMAQTDNNWTGAVSSAWGVDGNWSAGVVPTKSPGNHHAVINTNSPNIATITVGIIPPTDIIVGSNATGTLNHPSGDAATGSGNWMMIGRHAGGNGTYNLADTTSGGGAFTGFGQGSGSMIVSQRLYVGGLNGNGTGLCNVNTSGLLTIGNDLAVGAAGGTGVMNIDAGTISTSGWNFIGKNENGTGANGTLRMSGGTFTNTGRQYVGTPTCTGTFELTGGSFTNNSNLLIGGTTDGDSFLGESPDGTGHLHVSGENTSLTVGGEFTIGNRGSTGNMTFGGGTIASQNWTQVGRNGGHGTLTMTGGTWNKTGGGDFVVGDFNNSTGTLHMSGGSINCNNTFRVSSSGTGVLNLSGSASISAGNQFWVGQGGGGNGTLNFSGGSLAVGNWVAIGRENGTGLVEMTGGTWTKNASDTNFIIGSSATGTMNMSGGSVTVADSGPVDRGITWIGETNNCTGTLNLSGGQFSTERFVLGVQSGTTGNLNLNGGTVITSRIHGGSGTANVTFNGTQIFATTNSSDFLNNLDSAAIGGGGLLVNDMGFQLTAPQLLTGAGGIVKSGQGSLTLTAANSYSGPTTVEDGELHITTAATSGGALTVNDFAGFGVTQSAADDSITVSAASFGFESTLDIDLGNFAGNTAVAPLDISGTLTLDGPVYVNVADAQPVLGTIPLVSYGSETILGSGFELMDLPDGVQATLTDNGTGLVSLNVTRVNDPYWTGAESEFWNTSAANWVDGYSNSATTFANGDPALFNDSATGTTNVVLNVSVAPGGSGVTFANSTDKTYTLTGTGSITGDTGLRKENTGTATISTTNSYTGVTTLAGGILSVPVLTDGEVPSPIGAADSFEENIIFAGGTLYYTGGATATDRGFTTTAAGGGIGTDNNLTLEGPAFSTGGNFIKTGPGNLIFTNDDNTFGGGGISGLIVDGGTLTLDGTGGSQFNSLSGDLWVGTTAASGAHLVLEDTTLVSSGNYLAIARGGGTTGLVSTGTINNSTVSTGNLSLAYDNGVPGYLATAHLTLNDSTYTMPGTNRLGESNGGTGVLTLNGSSIMSVGETNVGQNSGSNGTLHVKGDSLYTSNGRLQVGSGGGSTGEVIIDESGEIVVNSYVSVGFNGSGSMTVKGNGIFSNNDDFSVNESGDAPVTVNLQENGAINVERVVYVGRNTGRVGTVNQTGGTFTSTGNEFQIGVVGQGTWLLSGGAVNAGGWTSIGRHGGSTGVVTVSGGTFTQTGTDRGLMIGEAGSGTLTVQASGSVVSLGSAGVNVGFEAPGNGTVNLDGGTFSALRVVGGPGTSAFNFNGGLLRAGAGASPAFMHSLDTANVKAGGANIDSNGQNIAIAQPLLDGDALGGGLTKTGAGFLQLNGTNTYTGTTTVSAGSLGGTGSVAGPLLVSGTGTLAPGASVGTFTSGSATIAGTYAVEIEGATSDVLAVNGNLNLDGATIAVSASAPAGSQWTIATYSGTLSANIAGVTAGYTLDTGTPGVVKLVSDGSGSNYQNWAQLAGLTGANDGPTVDAESDGIENMLEFVLGGNPLASDTSILPDVDASGANFVFTFNRSDESEAEIGLVFQYGSNLTGWTDVVIGADNASSGAGVNIVENGAAPDTVTVTVPKGANAKLFGRLKAQK